MTYQEAESLIQANIKRFQLHPYFIKEGVNSEFRCLLIGPAASDSNYKKQLYQEVIIKGNSNEAVLRIEGRLYEEQRVFIIYRQRGEEIIAVFDPLLF